MKKILSLILACALLLAVSACSGEKEQENVDLAAFADTVFSKYEFSDFLQLADPEDEMSAQMLDNFYAGLSDIQCRQSLVYICNMSMNTGEFALIQVANEADAEKVAEILQGRIDGMINGGAWYPEPTEIWTNQSAVVTNGSYVMMVVNPDYQSIVDDFNALFA